MFHVKQIDDFLFIKSVGNVCNIATYGQEPQNGLNVKTVKFHDGKGHLPRPYAGARSTARKRQRHARRPTAGRALLRRRAACRRRPGKRPSSALQKASFHHAKDKLRQGERQALGKTVKTALRQKREPKSAGLTRHLWTKDPVRLIRPIRTISPTGPASPIIILM